MSKNLFFLVISFCCMISCEWIQIPQSTSSPHAITLNTSLLMKNAKIHVLDHSKYSGFFSYIKPYQDHVKVNESIVNFYYKNESDRNDNTDAELSMIIFMYFNLLMRKLVSNYKKHI